ncbi:MAG TPA: hypothetical protein VND65_18115 [Candidatus Binatia bacterium]|nr:hypothetical protein [Candidatus Binatia bacterium]
MAGEAQNGEDRKARLVGIAVYFNPDDENLPVIYELQPGSEKVPVHVFQMMLLEAHNQLSDLRRAANAKAIASQIKNEQADETVRRNLARGMHS